jgi:divalent metal cation (Fe/Co/Zn/Cd) transporter
VRRGVGLEWLTVGWNVVEAVVSIAAGWFAGSVALVGFGLDSVIESTSGAALLWRLRRDDPEQRERAEHLALRLVAVSFLLLAIYVAAESLHTLLAREAPEASVPGLIIAALSLVVMPLLARAKRRVSAAIESRALHADSRQTDLCAVLSAILLVGLGANAVLGWWWADPVAGLAMVPIIAREGFASWKGQPCGCAH